MTDTVEQAARVLAVYWKHNHTNESLGRQRMLAQALADAGLLREPARTMPTRDEITQAIETATQNWDEPLDEVHDIPPITNAILALMADQPTVEDVRDAAVAEERIRNDNGNRTPLKVVMNVAEVEARAQQNREEGK